MTGILQGCLAGRATALVVLSVRIGKDIYVTYLIDIYYLYGTTTCGDECLEVSVFNQQHFT